MQDNIRQNQVLSLLGSTGSIGRQTLDVLRAQPGRFRVAGLAAGRNHELVRQQVVEFRPELTALADEVAYRALLEGWSPPPGCEIACGDEAVERVAALPGVGTVVAGITGARGLKPVLAALRLGRRVALANKEVLVAAGEIVDRLVREHGGALIPVDSEHSAIFQCLVGESPEHVGRLILTASGGPFRGRSRDSLAGVTPEQALKHPNWSMGAKITIDSATLMNKGLEVIEARWLFHVPAERIAVTVHPQSIIHSMVEFVDHSIVAQLGIPDMRLPIQYALGYPERLPGTGIPRLDPLTMGPLTFEPPDLEAFRCLRLAYDAIRMGGGAATVLNAANEIAVELFLARQLSFLGIPALLESVLEALSGRTIETLESVLVLDADARASARELAARFTEAR